MDSLKISDAEAAKHAVAPRVTLDDINAAISSEYCFTAFDAVASIGMPISADSPLKLLTLCIITLRNGFTVVGKSAPASAENFNAELGQKFAREDAKRQMWPLMGFALRERLAAA